MSCGLHKLTWELGVRCSIVLTLKHTHLFGIVLLCVPVHVQQSECFTQTIRYAAASWNGSFGQRGDFLAEVCVENNRTADALHRKTLPAKR